IEICDRRVVFMWPTSRLKSFGLPKERNWHPDHKPDPTPGFVGWIDGWNRDTEMNFRHVSEAFGGELNEKMRGSAGRLQGMAEQMVLPNATGRIVVNISLAIRRAFDRIAEHRWEAARKRATAKTRAQ